MDRKPVLPIVTLVLLLPLLVLGVATSDAATHPSSPSETAVSPRLFLPLVERAATSTGSLKARFRKEFVPEKRFLPGRLPSTLSAAP